MMRLLETQERRVRRMGRTGNIGKRGMLVRRSILVILAIVALRLVVRQKALQPVEGVIVGHLDQERRARPSLMVVDFMMS